MITVSGLSFTYDQSTRLEFADLTADQDTHTLILGQSGCGKTTLLHLLGGLLKPDRGEVNIDGTEITGLSGSQLDHFRGKNIGFVFQRPHLIRALNVEDNLFLAQYLSGLPKDKLRVMEVLKDLNIHDKRNSRIHELSEGQAQRVAIARAVLNHPKVLLADEPTSSLDDEHCESVIKILLEMADLNNSCLIIATHDQRLKDVITNHIYLKAV